MVPGNSVVYVVVPVTAMNIVPVMVLLAGAY